jgi:hypothetical protein
MDSTAVRDLLAVGFVTNVWLVVRLAKDSGSILGTIEEIERCRPPMSTLVILSTVYLMTLTY